MDVSVHTDGSIVGGNPGGAGGWAFVIKGGGKERVESGMIEAPCTNNRAEMQALIEAMRAFKWPTTFTVHSDSEYLLKPLINRTIEEWAGRNFTKQRKRNKYSGPHKNEAMPNADLWELINELDIRHNVTYQHVRGHAGDQLNEICHEQALSAARIAWAYHEKGMVPQPLPDSLEGRTRLLDVIKSVPMPPDPPRHRPIPQWAIFERQSRYKFYARWTSRPMNASEHEDGGEEWCRAKAKKMNDSVWRDPERKKKEVGGKPIYEARSLDWPLEEPVRLEAV